LTSLDGKKLLHRLSLANSYNDEEVHTNDGGIKSSSKEIVQEQTKDILEGENFIHATTKTSSTGATRKLKD
jgi:hypothetical protein